MSNHFMKHKQDDNTASTIVGYILGVLIIGLLFLWYNHVLLRAPVHYWQWCALAIPITIFAKNPILKWPLAALLIVTSISQVAAWIGLLELPIFHR